MFTGVDRQAPSQQTYGYAAMNPLYYTDPSGEFVDPVTQYAIYQAVVIAGPAILGAIGLYTSVPKLVEFGEKLGENVLAPEYVNYAHSDKFEMVVEQTGEGLDSQTTRHIFNKRTGELIDSGSMTTRDYIEGGAAFGAAMGSGMMVHGSFQQASAGFRKALADYRKAKAASKGQGASASLAGKCPAQGARPGGSGSNGSGPGGSGPGGSGSGGGGPGGAGSSGSGPGGNGLGGSGPIGAGQGSGKTPPNNVVIGKWDPKTNEVAGIKTGENSLLKHLPYQGCPKLDWKQNSGVLRIEMLKGLPIRDAHVGSDGALLPGSPDGISKFIDAERNLLSNHGWGYDPSTTLWSPSSGN